MKTRRKYQQKYLSLLKETEKESLAYHPARRITSIIPGITRSSLPILHRLLNTTRAGIPPLHFQPAHSRNNVSQVNTDLNKKFGVA